MKRALAILCASAISAQSAHIAFDLSILQTGPISRRAVEMFPAAIQTNGNSIATMDSYRFFTSTLGLYTVSNVVAGDYTVVVRGPNTNTVFDIAVPATNALIQAATIISDDLNTTGAATGYSQVQANARFVLRDSGHATNLSVYNDTLTNVFRFTNSLPGYVLKTDGTNVYLAASGAGESTTGSNLSITNATTFAVFYRLNGSDLEHRTVRAGANMVITNEGTNLVFASTASGSSALETNANQFGASVTLTLKKSPWITNLVTWGPTTNNDATYQGGNILPLAANSYKLGEADNIWQEVHGGVMVSTQLYAYRMIYADHLTASRVAVINAQKQLTNSGVSTTTLGFLDATSSIQTQFDNLTGSTNAINTSVVNLIAATNSFQTRIGNLEGATNGLDARLTTASNALQIATSNNVRVAAGTAIGVTPSGSGDVQTYTVAVTDAELLEWSGVSTNKNLFTNSIILVNGSGGITVTQSIVNGLVTFGISDDDAGEGGGGASTNENQFGAAGAVLTIKTGSYQTNNFFWGVISNQGNLYNFGTLTNIGFASLLDTRIGGDLTQSGGDYSSDGSIRILGDGYIGQTFSVTGLFTLRGGFSIPPMPGSATINVTTNQVFYFTTAVSTNITIAGLTSNHVALLVFTQPSGGGQTVSISGAGELFGINTNPLARTFVRIDGFGGTTNATPEAPGVYMASYLAKGDILASDGTNFVKVNLGTGKIAMGTNANHASGVAAVDIPTGGGSSAFDDITSGQNTSASMQVGSGATISVSGGQVHASHLTNGTVRGITTFPEQTEPNLDAIGKLAFIEDALTLGLPGFSYNDGIYSNIIVSISRPDSWSENMVPVIQADGTFELEAQASGAAETNWTRTSTTLHPTIKPDTVIVPQILQASNIIGSNFVMTAGATAQMTQNVGKAYALVLTNASGQVGYSPMWPDLSIGRMSWLVPGNTTPGNSGHGEQWALIGGNFLFTEASATLPPVFYFLVSGTANTTNALRASNQKFWYPGKGTGIDWRTGFYPGTTNAVRNFFGLTDGSDTQMGTALPNRDMAVFRYDDTMDNGNYKFITSNSGSAWESNDTGIAYSPLVHHHFRIKEDVAASTWYAFIDGVPVATNTANIPAGAAMQSMSILFTYENAAKTNYHSYIQCNQPF